MSQEKLKILKMIEEGIISSEEGFQLLEALGSDDGFKKTSKNQSAKWVRIIVTHDKQSDNVNIRLPIALIKAGMKIGETFSPSIKSSLGDVDYDLIIQAIDGGDQGEVLSLQSGEGHDITIILE